MYRFGFIFNFNETLIRRRSFPIWKGISALCIPAIGATWYLAFATEHDHIEKRIDYPHLRIRNKVGRLKGDCLFVYTQMLTASVYVEKSRFPGAMGMKVFSRMNILEVRVKSILTEMSLKELLA